MTTFDSTIIVSFHIGRGGRFNNPGHLSFLGENKISAFTDDLFLAYENEKNFKDRFGFDSTGDKDQRCILDLIANRDFDELQEKFGITQEMLGNAIFFHNGNPVGLTEDDAEKGIGRINIDNYYDTTYSIYLTRIDKQEALAILVYSGSIDICITDYAKEILGIENETEESND